MRVILSHIRFILDLFNVKTGAQKNCLARNVLLPGVLLFNVVVLGQAPIANFTSDITSGCAPLIVQFQNTSTGNPTSYLWEFGNGNTSTLANPVASYLTPGTYTVKLTVRNASGSNTLTRSNYIVSYGSPRVGFTSSATVGCFPHRVQFTDTSSTAAGTVNTTWNWNFGSGQTSTQPTCNITYNTAGTFNVSLKVTNDKGCSSTITRTSYITVNPGVKATYTHTAPTVCAAPTPISFTNTSVGTGNLSYSWNFGDGVSSTAANPTHTYQANGSFTVTLVAASSNGCVDTFRSNPITVGGFTTNFNMPTDVCIGTPVSFINASSPAPVSSQWNFGDGTGSSNANPAHTYNTTGSYLVKLVNTYSICQDSAFRIISVRPRPVARFSAPIRTKCAPDLLVNFQDESTGNPVAWDWNFGDGNTSTAQHPTHTYTTYGSFTVRLITTSQYGCKDTISMPNYVNIRRAQIQIPSLPVQDCVPYTHLFGATVLAVDSVLTYQWSFGDGNTSTGATPSHTYTVQGTYDVKVAITTSTGCRDTLLLNTAVRVGTPPTPNFTATPNPVCGTQPVQFTDQTPLPADIWTWTFGDGSSSTNRNPSHRYLDTGYFSVKLTVLNNGCERSITKINYVKVLPAIARFTPVPNCTNRLSFSFNNESLGATSNTWDFGDGSPISTATSPTHVFPALGNYTIRLIARNGSCADTITKSIRLIDENPGLAASQTTLCKIGTVDFQVTQINRNNINQYDWDFGNGLTTNTTTDSIRVTYANNGLYSIRLITTDLNGCKDSVNRINYIRVNGPTARFRAVDTSGCKGFTTTFTDQSSIYNNYAITQWQWHFGDGSVHTNGAATVSHQYNTVGSFAVKLVITDAIGCKDSITNASQIHSTDPVPVFSADSLSCPGANVSFVNGSSPAGLTSTWTFGDGAGSSSAQPVHAYQNSGFYDVKLVVRDMYGCTDSLIRNQYIRINTPRASFTKDFTHSSCTPFRVQFTNTSTFSKQSNWSFGPGENPSTLTNPVYFFNRVDSFPIKLIATSPGGCRDSMVQFVRVHDTANSRLNYTATIACKPYTAGFAAVTPGPMASYMWDLGDGSSVTNTTNFVHTYKSLGNYYPSVIAIDSAGCRIPIVGTGRIQVRGVSATFESNINMICDQGTVQFRDSVLTNNAPVQYQWQFGDGATSTQSNPSHLYTTAGNYTVRLITVSQSGCRDTLTKPNMIKLSNRPKIRLSGVSQACQNSTLQHLGNLVSPDTSAVSWLWSFPNGSSINNPLPPAQTYKYAGNFQVRAISTNSSGCKDTAYLPLRIDPLPTINLPKQVNIQNGFSMAMPVTYTSNVNQWSWSPSDGLSCTQCPRPVLSARSTKLYQVQVQDSNGCRNYAMVQIQPFCETSNMFFPNTFSPNGDGSNDVYYPRGRGLDRIKSLQILNRWGQVVFQNQNFSANDPSQGWNGRYQGQAPQPETYIYTAEVYCENGTLFTLTGNIALLR